MILNNDCQLECVSRYDLRVSARASRCLGAILVLTICGACGEDDLPVTSRPFVADAARPDEEVDAQPDPAVFIAFARDFIEFRTWRQYVLENSVSPLTPAPHDDGGVEDTDAGTAHVTGPRTVFINKIPPPRATQFVVGTVIVKAMTGSADLFAMVKRGGNYNAKGAVGWEWFRLSTGRDSTPVIVWRGLTPPTGDNYSGASGGTCNDCHEAARPNDFVHSPWLRLGQP